MDIHANATQFINDNVENNASAVVDLLPEDIVSDKNVEANSLSSFPFISGLDNDFKANVDNFIQLEVGLGILNKTISHEDLYWEG